ncbi:hypothetical protein L486_04007 [Kwoniella mangroviensis CBS 10435]|uniref:Uncharacterized protein n=1 Tax=Kwoniella mangroviensis CBS 10435 TaxID=1331196 RepID=A0A1B9IRB8_9TREE|nr:hypothetical protein L486_04007 [Kwoniella mangroviensis CBS 10435]
MSDLSHYARIAHFQGSTYGLRSATSENSGDRTVVADRNSFVLNYPGEGDWGTDRQLVYSAYGGTSEQESQLVRALRIMKDDGNMHPASTVTYNGKTLALIESVRGNPGANGETLEEDEEYHVVLKREGGNGDDLHLLFSSYAETC